MIKPFLTFCFVFSFAFCSHAASTQQEIRDEVFPVISEGIEEAAQNKDVEKRSVAEIITFRDPKFVRLIEECFEIMADSPFVDLMTEQENMLSAIQKKQKQINELTKKSFTAPPSSWNPFKTTQESIREDIKELKAEIENLRSEFQQKKDSVFLSMEQAGVPIAREQFELMINAVDSSDQAKIMAVAENLKFINEEIKTKVSDPNAPIDLIKIYTGVYMMSYKIYLYSIEQAMLSIESQYMPKLSEMKQENQKLYNDSVSLLSQKQTAEDKQLLKNNISQQERMVTVINTYEKYLINQHKRLQALSQFMNKRFKVAENTFHTIRLSSELLSLIRTTDADFSRIFEFKPAELSVLYEERLRKEFMEVSESLKLKNK